MGNSLKKTFIWVGPFLILFLFLRVSHIDAWLWHKWTYQEPENSFIHLSQSSEVQEWLELRKEDPEEAVRQLQMLNDEQRFEELALVIHEIPDEQKDLVISTFFTLSSGEVNLIPRPEIRWLAADDVWFFIQNRGIGISRNELDGQLFFVYGATLFHAYEAQKFISLVENYDRRIMVEFLEVLHFALITAPENTSFLSAFSNCTNFLQTRTLEQFLSTILDSSTDKSPITVLPKKSQNALRNRFRREVGYFGLHNNL